MAHASLWMGAVLAGASFHLVVTHKHSEAEKVDRLLMPQDLREMKKKSTRFAFSSERASNYVTKITKHFFFNS